MSKKRKPHPGSRSLAEQLKEAFPTPSVPDTSKATDSKVPGMPQVRRVVVPAKPPAPPAPKPAQPEKRLGAPPPPTWEPPREELFLEPAFPHELASSIVPSLAASPRASTGAATSVAPGIRRTQTVARVQVGLDFGTSATKVLWVRMGVADPKVSAVDFQHGLADLPRFCLPSVAAFDLRGGLLFGDVALSHLRSGPAASALTRFKMLVAGEQDERYLDRHTQWRFGEHVRLALGDESSCTPEMVTAAYLAFVMRRVRHQLTNELPGLDLDVSFATCVPVDQVQDNVVATAFRRVVNAAELLEREASDGESGRAWLDRAQRELSSRLLDEAEAKVHLVPEAVAATAGYIHSMQRNRGIHALIDIGAGTTDVSIFNVLDWGRGDPETVWYAARSIPRGTAVLEARLADELQRQGKVPNPRMVLASLQGDRDEFPSARALIQEELETIWRRSHQAWGEAHLHLRNETSWKGDAVNVFLSGGGSLIPESVRVFRNSWMTSPNWGPYPCRPVPEPDGYDAGRVGGPFVRVNVAHGLTRPLPELGQWVLPKDAPDHTPPPLPRREWQFDGDQIVPNSSW